MKNIGYHTRLRSNNSTKVVGGSFGGSLDIETVNRLVKSHFSVKVLTSGTPVFIDSSGREVSLYLSVDAGSTEEGALALKAWRTERARQNAEDEAREQREQAEVNDLMEGLSHDEIVRRLRGPT